MIYTYARTHPLGYECSGRGDRRFSALYARLPDGRTIEEAYQLDVKGYRVHGNDWRLGKGKPPLRRDVDLYAAYLSLWREWAEHNASALTYLRRVATSGVLTDMFAASPVSQARALADLLNAGYGVAQ